MPDPPEHEPWLFSYTIEGDLRFLSHHETLRMFERALVRAGLPLRYTKGFNPHPKLSNPLPLPVGVASEAESLIVDMNEPVDGPHAMRELQTQLPRGVHLTGARRVEPDERFQCARVRYRLEVTAPFGEGVPARVGRIQEAASLPVERVQHKSGSRHVVDVRPYLMDLRIDGDAVEFTLRVTGSGTARPAEIAGLLGLDPTAVNHRIRRMAVRWD